MWNILSNANIVLHAVLASSILFPLETGFLLTSGSSRIIAAWSTTSVIVNAPQSLVNRICSDGDKKAQASSEILTQNYRTLILSHQNNCNAFL